MTDLILALAACASTGIAFAFAVKVLEMRGYIARQDRTARAAHEREVATATELADWREEVALALPVIAEGKRRYGIEFGPRIEATLVKFDPDAGSRALLQLVPGFARLSDGEYATDRIGGPREEFTGWTPPAALAEPAPKPRRRRTRALSLSDGRGPDGASAESSGPRLAGGSA